MSTRRLGVAGALVGGELVPGDVEIEDGQVVAVGLSAAGSGTAVPGFVDLQVNGFAGVDFLHASTEQLTAARGALAETGVVAFQPTLITSQPADTARAATAVASARDLNMGAKVIGVHLEGPFLSPRRAGTHPLSLLRQPDWDLLAPLLETGSVTMVTVAPELPGATALIARLVSAGVVVSLGHSDATAAQTAAGFAAGATAVTHLFNAMRPFQPRDPGIAGAALVHGSVFLGVIADRVHLADETLTLIWQAARERLVVVTDAIAAARREDGQWQLGEVEVTVTDGVARRGDGTLAGSVVTMDQSLRNLVQLGLPLVDAVRATSTNPRRMMGLAEGDLSPGTVADLIVLDDRYEVTRTLIDGREVT